MRGQKFTSVAPHIQEKRKGAGAIGTMESAQKRTKTNFEKVFLEDSVITKIEKLINKIEVIILTCKTRYPKEFSFWENTLAESHVTVMPESLLESGIIRKKLKNTGAESRFTIMPTIESLLKSGIITKKLESLLKSGIITKKEDILTIKQFRNKIPELKKIIIVKKIRKSYEIFHNKKSKQEFDLLLKLMEEAKKAGIKEGDIIMDENDKIMHDDTTLLEAREIAIDLKNFFCSRALQSISSHKNPEEIMYF